MQGKSLKKRNIIINVCIIVAVTALAFFYLTKSEIIKAESLKQVEWYNFLILFGAFSASFTIISLVDFLVYRSFTNSMTYGKCLVNTLSGNLGSGITPFRSGHFPLMIYYQNRAGVPIGDTVTGLVKCQIIYSATSILVYITVVTILLVTGACIVFNGVTVKLWLVVSLGLLFHLAVFIAIVILAFNRRIQAWALRLWAKFLVKIKRLEDIEGYIAEKTVRLNLYKRQIEIIGSKFYKYLAPCAIYALYMIVSCSFQYFAYLLITGANFNFITLFTFYTLNLASGYITNIIPVPGGSGTSELLFPLVFASVIPDSYIGAVLILWRISTYYLAIVFEVLVFLPAVFIKRKSKTSSEKV